MDSAGEEDARAESVQPPSNPRGRVTDAAVHERGAAGSERQCTRRQSSGAVRDNKISARRPPPQGCETAKAGGPAPEYGYIQTLWNRRSECEHLDIESALTQPDCKTKTFDFSTSSVARGQNDKNIHCGINSSAGCKFTVQTSIERYYSGEVERIVPSARVNGASKREPSCTATSAC